MVLSPVPFQSASKTAAALGTTVTNLSLQECHVDLSNLVSGMWQYGIDQWVGQNEFLYGKTKEERLAKTTQEVDSQIQHMHRADRKRVCSIDKHLFHMSAEQRIT